MGGSDGEYDIIFDSKEGILSMKIKYFIMFASVWNRIFAHEETETSSIY